MVIIKTSAIEVSIQAVSPELGVHSLRTVAEQAGGAGGAAAAAAGAAAAGAGAAAAGAAGAAAAGAAAGAAGAAAAGAAGWSSAFERLGAAKPMNAANAKAGARLANNRESLISLNSGCRFEGF